MATVIMKVPNNTNPVWWKDPGLRKLNILLISTFMGSIANGYNGSLIAGLEAIPRWFQDLGGLEDKNSLGLLIAANSFGGIAAFFLAPSIADKLGRRWGIMIGNIGTIAAIIGQCFCKTGNQFLGTRLIIGFFAVFNSISAPALLAELAHPRQRAVMGALYSTFYFLLWVTAQLLLALPTPESPRWLVKNNRSDEAKKILAKFHANGDESDELVNLEFTEICSSIEAVNGKTVTWASLFTTPRYRKRVLICIGLGLSIQWQGINGGLQIFNWFLSIGGALLADRAGRRRLFLVSSCSMLLFMIMVLVCSAVFTSTGSQSVGIAVVVFLCLFLGGYVIGFAPIPSLYINEIWPTEVRAKGTSVFWFSSTVAQCFNQWVNPIALASIQWKYYSVYVCVLAGVTVFIYLFIPETRGRSLEEAGGIFDAKYTGTTIPTAGLMLVEEGAASVPKCEEETSDVGTQV
ncbi:major facilitator superfamily domain-containing protein [Xylariales sp. PMI_506]|nr:major facilitator superfamily domain-containing protein [Xylariales sp. PMI_506]